MLYNLRSYQLAVQFYRDGSGLKCPSHLKSQFLRAASSVVLNLSEGSARPTEPDRKRFYAIALGSTRECQSILDLVPTAPLALIKQADILGAHVYRLAHSSMAARKK